MLCRPWVIPGRMIGNPVDINFMPWACAALFDQAFKVRRRAKFCIHHDSRALHSNYQACLAVILFAYRIDRHHPNNFDAHFLSSGRYSSNFEATFFRMLTNIRFINRRIFRTKPDVRPLKSFVPSLVHARRVRKHSAIELGSVDVWFYCLHFMPRYFLWGCLLLYCRLNGIAIYSSSIIIADLP